MGTKKATTPNSITELRNGLLEAFARLASGSFDRKDALALSRVADITIQTVKAEMMYSKARGETPDIEFLKGN